MNFAQFKQKYGVHSPRIFIDTLVEKSNKADKVLNETCQIMAENLELALEKEGDNEIVRKINSEQSFLDGKSSGAKIVLGNDGNKIIRITQNNDENVAWLSIATMRAIIAWAQSE